MPISASKFPLFFVCFSALIASCQTAFAQDDTCDETQAHAANPLCVTITAFRLEEPLDRVGSSITVLTHDELTRRGDHSVADALKRVPGISMARSGGIGGITEIYMRGALPGQTKVLIDGVPVSDASDSANAFDFNALLVADIDRIEVLRGPQSALYGSDAIGGVINILTNKKANGWRGFAEAGSYDTFQEGLDYSGKTEDVTYRLSAQNFKTGGFSASAAGKEKDGSRISSFKGGVGYKPLENLAFDFSGGYEDSTLDYDPSSTTDGPAFLDKKFGYGSGSAKLTLLDGMWDNTLKFGGSRTRRNYDEPVGFNRYSSYDGKRLEGSYQSDLHLRVHDVATIGAEWMRETARTSTTNFALIRTFDLDRGITNRALFGQYLLSATDDWTFTLGGRHDDHSQFGSANTYRLTTAYKIPSTGTLLRSSYGTGFKAPSLFQLYTPNFGPAGNPNLLPERSRGYDVGVEQQWLDNRVNVGVTAFHNKFRNMILYDFGSTPRYQNVARANARGLESTAKFRASPELLISLNHTYTLSEDESNHRKQLRVPMHSGNVLIDYDVTPQARLGTQLRYNGARWDNTFSDDVIKSYATVDLTGSYDMDKDLTLYSRVENLFDRRYHDGTNYNAAGLSVYVGVRASY